MSQLSSGSSPLQIGLSTHAPEQARRALESGAGYLAIGPVYATGTKPGVKPVTLQYVRWAAANVSIPWFAIGGVDVANVAEVVAAGAPGVAVVRAIRDADDPEVAARTLRRALDRQE